MKKFTALFLALVMSFALAVPAGAAEAKAATDVLPAGELDGSIVILHTNDVHGNIEGYAAVAALKSAYQEAGASVILMDAGDYTQGDPGVNLSQGATAIELMNLAGYDIATLGNHEFDYGYENLKTILKDASFPVVAANVLYDDESAFQDAHIFDTEDGVSVGVFGLDTPETATKSHPAKIQGVTFMAGQTLFETAQAQVDMLKNEGCDYVICLGHLGIDAESVGNRSVDLLENVTGIDVFIDGHSHSTLDDIITAGYSQVGDTLLTSTGTKLANVGVIEIDAEGNINATSIPLDEETPDILQTYESYQTVATRTAAIRAEIEADYGVVFASTEVNLDGEKANVRAMETNLGDLITDAMLWAANDLGEPVDAAIANGGGIRASIPAGDITKKDINTVLPFGNTLYMVEVTGAELLEALEASTYCTPETVGGFPQVAGITYTIDTGKDFVSTELYPDSTYGKPASINRVSIQTVGGAAFDVNETYTVVTNDFLGAGGDTYYAFAASPIGYDLGVPLDEVVMDYITTELNGTITAEAYGETAGRITIADSVLPGPETGFVDVAPGAWYAEPVAWAVENGITTGTSDTTFGPGDSCTRAQMVTFLWRCAGEPAPTTEVSPFTDVTPGAWYYDAVLWAAENQVVNGLTATTFGPDVTVIREQVATILFRYAQAQGADVSVGEDTNILSYTDAESISEYAIPAMQWACGAGILEGADGKLMPKDDCTRAQIVTILFRADSSQLF